jgi:hypothetical protein
MLPIASGWARLLWPGVTSRVPADVLHLPSVQTLLDQQRLCVITECSRTPNARERLQRDMLIAIAQAERQAFDRLLARQQQRYQLPAAAVLGGKRPHTKADDEWLRAAWLAGTSRTAIARRLGITPQGAGLRAKPLGLPPRSFRRSGARLLGRP